MTPKHTIAKDFSFCFGHRVWTQRLEAGYAESTHCKCRHLHGHEAKVTVHLTADTLTDGMITDFNHLGWLKTFLDTYLDHKFVIDRNDPLFPVLVLSAPLEDVVHVGHVVGSIVDLSKYAQASPELLELLESFFIVDFVPTSENFSQWLHGVIEVKMAPLGVKVSAIEWWESPKSRSMYSV